MAIIGEPDVGKSTLLNQILCEKIAIATPSRRPRDTTSKGYSQAVIARLSLWTPPSIHTSRRLLNKMLVDSAMCAIKDALILMLVDASAWRKGQARDSLFYSG